MAHEYAKINVAIWGDQDFKALTRDEHWLYFLLWSHPDTDAAGVADWRPGRLAGLAADATAAEVRRIGESLQSKRFLLIDEDTEEVLIRSYIKHDQRMKQPNAAKSVVNAYAGTASVKIQAVIVHELQKLKASQPDYKGFTAAGCKEAVENVLKQPASPIDFYLNPSSDPSVDPSDDPSVNTSVDPSVGGQVMGSVDPSVKGSLTETETETPSNEGGVGGTVQKRRAPETAFPEDFTPTDSHCSKAAEYGVDVNWEAQKFEDHHRSKDSRFRDWSRAFHTWLRNAAEYSHGRPGKPPPPAPRHDPWKLTFDDYAHPEEATRDTDRPASGDHAPPF